MKAIKHGMCNTKFYRVWNQMKSRCRDHNNPSFRYYGGRGIKVCDRWMDFTNFYSDMYSAYSEGLSIERIDVNGNYEPSNCKWITMAEQQVNVRSAKHFLVDGKLLTQNMAAKSVGLSATTFHRWAKSGLTIQEIISRKNNRAEKRKNYKMKHLFLLTIAIISLLASCTVQKYNANGCPAAKQGSRHDRNLRF